LASLSSEGLPVTEPTSHSQILRSSSIIGGASVINILIGLLRIKVVAVLLGPAGVGLIGLLQNIMATASTVAALGFGTVGTRQIAEAAGLEDQPGIDTARRALFWGTLGLAVFGGVAAGAAGQKYSDSSFSDMSLAPVYGAQLGGIMFVSDSLMLELGYRLRLTNLETEITTIPASIDTVDQLNETYLSLILSF